MCFFDEPIPREERVAALSVASPTANFERVEIERRRVGEYDVGINIHYSGICHSDIHTVKDEWKRFTGGTRYPLVPGHEGVGVVSEVGSGVTKFKTGDLVGVGCFVDTCRSCSECVADEDSFCKGKVMTYDSVHKYERSGEDLGKSTDGTYSEYMVVNENYVLRIPDNLNFSKVAPLLCAGITVYSPLKRHNVGKGVSVGIVGFGGLGYMATQIARAMGAEVTVFSRGTQKKKLAQAEGCHHFVDSTNKKEMKAASQSVDLMISTISADYEVIPLISCIRHGGSFCFVGLPPHKMEFATKALAARDISLTGSLIGGIKETQEMIDFCGVHDITCKSELISPVPSEIDAAYERVIAGDIYFRFVIDFTRQI